MPKPFAVKSRSAQMSPCGTYRYTLKRHWDDRFSPVLFIMLNPSTADMAKDDPTVRRVMGYARRWGYGGVAIVNLFALRTPNPKDLRTAKVDPVGPYNDMAILAEADTARKEGASIIAAWGNNGTYKERDLHVITMLRQSGATLDCLDLTVTGVPKHPLYLPNDLSPRRLP